MKSGIRWVTGIYFLLNTSCAKAPLTHSYEEIMRLQNLTVAIPLGSDEKPIYKEVLFTATSEIWCTKRIRLRLPDGNEWKNQQGFLCVENGFKNATVFQQLKRQNPNWQFRWRCTADESGCVIKK